MASVLRRARSTVRTTACRAQSTVRMNTHAQFYWLQSRGSKAGAFGPALLDQNLREWGGPVSLIEKSNNHTVATARLPPWCARRDGRPPLGALLALVDQVSTFCGQAEFDGRGRPGVSLFLSGEVVDEAPSLEPGCGIEISTSLLKGGRTLAWLACEVFSDGELVVRARHAKFLKIDPLHDLLVHSPLHNAALPILSRYYESLEPHPYVGDDTCLDAIFRPRRIQENAFEVDVTKDHCNGLGGLHGGAACILAEHASGDDKPLAAMHVSLMRGLKAGSVARVSRDAGRVSIVDATGAACYEATVSPVV